MRRAAQARHKPKMKARLILNLALLAAVVGLGLFFYFKPKAGNPAEFPLSDLKVQEVTRVMIERQDGALTLERRGAVWYVTAPFQSRADPIKIQSILDIASAKSKQRLAARDLARFDLDQPPVRVTIDGRQFSYGAVNTLTREQYVATGDSVFLVPLHFGSAIPRRLSDLAARQVLADDEAPVRFEFPDLTVAQQDGKWVTRPELNLTQDEINQWVQEWRMALASRSEPDAKAKGKQDLKIALKDGKTMTFKILQKEPELVLARSDENMRYYFPQDTGKRLLNPGK